MHDGRRRVLRYLAATLALSATHCREKSRDDPRSKSAVPERIVSLSPSTTEILFALGAGDRIVGRTRYCDYPPESKAIPVVGGFVDANLEKIAQAKTDLVVGARGPGGQAIADKLTAIGIASLFPKTDSIADIDTAITAIAERIGLPERGRELIAAMRAKREAIAAAVAGAPRVRTLFVFGLEPIGVAGPGSFPNEMLELAGGDNVMKGGGAFPSINAETLVALDPEVILDASVTGRGLDASAVERTAPGWRDLGAVRRGNVVPILDLAVIRPGPRTAGGIATLARILHPEAKLP
ncbi:MAG: helical backbone metal receptor [Polyangiaceae bacterium]